MDWETIASDPEYKSLPPTKQALIKGEFDAKFGTKGEIPPSRGVGLAFDPKVAEGLDEGASRADYLIGKTKEGMANVGGMVADTGQNVMNLLGAAAGTAGIKSGAIKPEDAYEPRTDPILGSAHLKRLMGVKENAKAPDGITKFVGEALQFGTEMVLTKGKPTIAGTTGKEVAKEVTKDVAKVGAVAAGATAGKESAEASFPNNPIAATTGSLLGGLVIPSWVMSRASVISKMTSAEGRSELKGLVKDSTKGPKDSVSAYLEDKAKSSLAANIQASPNAVANIKEAMELEKKIKGLKLTAGQKTDAAGVKVNETYSAQSSPEAFENYQAVNRANTQVITNYITLGPASISTKKAVDNLVQKQDEILDNLKAHEDAVRSQVERKVRAMEVDSTPEQRGDVLRFQRAREEGRAKATADKLYAEAGEEAAKVRASFDGTAIEQRVSLTLNDPLIGFDPKNAGGLPAIARELARLRTDRSGKSGVEFFDAKGNKMKAEDKPLRLTYEEVKGLSTAVNQDISSVQSQLNNPNARPQLRALVELKKEINGTIVNSDYPEVAKKWGAAVEFYRNDYARRLLTGLNFKQTFTDSLGNQRVVTQKLLDGYISNPGNARNFVDLYGKNPEATVAMRDHLVDKYKGEIFKNGEFSEKAHSAFMKKNEDVLRALEKGDQGIMAYFNNTGKFMQSLADKQGYLSTHRTELANNELAHLLKTRDVGTIIAEGLKTPESMGRLSAGLGEKGSQAALEKVMGDVLEGGLDAKKLKGFLGKYGTQMEILSKEAYGSEKGKEYVANLKDASRALELQARTEIFNPKIEPTVGQDPLRQATGVTLRSLNSLYRAVIGGRTSGEDAAIAMGGQAASHLLNKRFNAVTQEILTDPEQTKTLLNVLTQQTGKEGTKALTAETKKGLGKLLHAGGVYLVGGNFYAPNAKLLAGSLAAEEGTK